MCFSAEASFSAAAVLVPVGLYALSKARRDMPGWALFASFPLVFGVQQALEGVVWIGLGSGDTELTYCAARGYLFFSNFLWPLLVPLAAWWLEQEAARRRAMALFAVLGFLFGLSIFLPTVLESFELEVGILQNSITYQTRLLHDSLISRSVVEVLYALIILPPLLMSSEYRIRIFGGLILLALVATYAAFYHALISVWCFLAAALSLYLVVAMQGALSEQGADPPGEVS